MATTKQAPAKSGNGNGAKPKSGGRTRKAATQVAEVVVAKLTGTKAKVSKEVADFLKGSNRLSIEDSDASRPKLRVFVDGQSEGLFISQKADGTLRLRNRPIFNVTSTTVDRAKEQPGCAKMPKYPNSPRGLAQAAVWWVDNVHRKNKGDQVGSGGGGRKRQTQADSKSLVKQTTNAKPSRQPSKQSAAKRSASRAASAAKKK